MAYIPPHLRNQISAQSSSSSKPSSAPTYDDGLRSIRDIQHSYWKSAEENGSGSPYSEQSTLNDSANSRQSLSYVLLFRDANPRWASDSTIFIKSNLDLLPEYSMRKREWIKEQGVDVAQNVMQLEKNEGTAPDVPTSTAQDSKSSRKKEPKGGIHPSHPDHWSSSRKRPLSELTSVPPLKIKPSKVSPTAVFEQRPGRDRDGNFAFAGWYWIESIVILAPFSRQLKKILEQKWQPKKDRFGKIVQNERDASDWQESIKHEWAVIKFVRAKGNIPDNPVVERAPQYEKGRGASRKSVNEMLAELRLGKDESSGEQKTAETVSGAEEK